MKIQNENTRTYSEEQVNHTRSRREKINDKKEKSVNFFMGNLNLGADSIEEKRKMAQKQALKVVGDAFAGQKKLDADMDVRRDKIKLLRDENKDAQDNIDDLDKQKSEFMEIFGVEADSQEQNDLELLEKEQRSRTNPKIELTDEEQERVKEIYKNGITEYQNIALDLSKQQNEYRKTIDKNNTQIEIELDILRKVATERLKDQSMLKAEAQSEEIQEAASKEIIGMLKQEAQDHIDEEQEKVEEAAKDKTEEKEETEELQEAIQEKAEQMEALAGKETEHTKKPQEGPSLDTGEMLDLDSANRDIKKELKNIVKDMNLVIEDIKGSQIDKEI